MLNDSASEVQSDGSLKHWGETVEFSGSSLPLKQINFVPVQYCVSALLISLFCLRRPNSYDFATITELIGPRQPCCFRERCVGEKL